MQEPVLFYAIFLTGPNATVMLKKLGFLHARINKF